jgi:hypothetical protein
MTFEMTAEQSGQNRLTSVATPLLQHGDIHAVKGLKLCRDAACREVIFSVVFLSPVKQMP